MCVILQLPNYCSTHKTTAALIIIITIITMMMMMIINHYLPGNAVEALLLCFNSIPRENGTLSPNGPCLAPPLLKPLYWTAAARWLMPVVVVTLNQVVNTRSDGSHQAKEWGLTGLVSLWDFIGRPSRKWVGQWLKQKHGCRRSSERKKILECLEERNLHSVLCGWSPADFDWEDCQVVEGIPQRPP